MQLISKYNFKRLNIGLNPFRKNEFTGEKNVL